MKALNLIRSAGITLLLLATASALADEQPVGRLFE
jgi:hypothetical protein